MTDSRPLILTAWLDDDTFAWADDLRKQHFPAKRNFIPAHLTLFHHLPGDAIATVADRLRQMTANHPPCPLQFPELRFLGFGSAVVVQCPELEAVRSQLASGWHDWLTRQDQQPWQPHITFQNKVKADQAKALFSDLCESWTPKSGSAIGLKLWTYLDGPWRHEVDFEFRGG